MIRNPASRMRDLEVHPLGVEIVETYLEHCQILTMMILKIFNGFQSFTIFAKISI